MSGGSELPIGGSLEDRPGYPSMNGDGRGDGTRFTAAGLLSEFSDHGNRELSSPIASSS